MAIAESAMACEAAIHALELCTVREGPVGRGGGETATIVNIPKFGGDTKKEVMSVPEG